MIAFTAFMSQYLNTDAMYIVLSLIIFAAIDFAIVKMIIKRKRSKAIQQSFAKRAPSVIY